MSRRLGGFVQEARRRANLTQQQAADLAGLSVAALRDLEQGRVAAPRSATLRRLAEALRLSIADSAELLRLGQPGQAPAEDLWFQVLGPLTVQARRVAVKVESARQRLLLGLLALSPNVTVSHTELIEAIWANRPPENAADLLRISAARLRRRLQRHRPTPDPAPPLVVAEGGYQLCVSENQLDLLLFRQLVGRARRARQDGDADRACRLFADAMALYRDRPLADLAPLRSHPAVAALAREWQAAAVSYAEAATVIGRHTEVLPWLRRVAEADPYHEGAHARLMVALAASGERAAALATFDALRTRLVEEHGTDPGPELRAAHQLVQRPAGAGHRGQAESAPVDAFRQLPSDLAEFTGRAAELRALHDRLPAGGAAVPAGNGSGTAVAIWLVQGMAGVGKTRLALHFAHQLLGAGEYADTQLYADLRGRAGQPPADPAAVLSAFLHLLGVPGDQIPEDLPGRAALYRDRLSASRGLVVLDDAAGEEQVLPLLPAGPGNLVLVTSRRSLALDGASVLPLAPFPPADAERLLAEVTGGQRVADGSGAARRVGQLCGHLPLAVSLVARRLRARPGWTLADLARRLEQAAAGGSLLDELAAGSQQLQAVFAPSYRALDGPARRLFRLLGRDPAADVTAESAARLAGICPVRARQLLDQLVDEHLAIMVSSERYRIPELLRHYAAELAAGPPVPAGRDRPAELVTTAAADLRAGQAAGTIPD